MLGFEGNKGEGILCSSLDDSILIGMKFFVFIEVSL